MLLYGKDFVVDLVVHIAAVVVVHIVVIDPRNLPLKFGQNWVGIS